MRDLLVAEIAGPDSRLPSRGPSDHPAVGNAAPFKTTRRSRVVLLVCLCGLLVVGVIAVGTGVLLSTLRERALDHEKRELQSLALAVAEQTDRTFQAIELVQNTFIGRIRELGISSRRDFEQHMSGQDVHLKLKDMTSGLPFVAVICLTSLDATLINFSRSWPIEDPDVSERDYVKALLSDPQTTSFVSRPLRNPTTGVWTIYLARKVVASDGELLGLIGTGIDLQYFEKFFSSVLLEQYGSIALYKNDGVLLARFPTIDATVGNTYTAFARALGDNKDRGTIRIVGRMDGKDRLLAVQRVPHYPIVVSVGVDVAAALADWQRGAIYIAGAAVLIICVIGAGIALTAWQVASRLRAQNLRFNIALSNMAQGLCMFDAQQRLLVANDRFAQIYGLRPEQVKPGTGFRDIIVHRIANGMYAGENPEEYIRERLAAVCKRTADTRVHELPDGRLISIKHQPMDDGGWVATHEDVTDRQKLDRELARRNDMLSRKEAELSAKNMQFDAALNNMAQGLVVFDANRRLIVANRRYSEIYGLPRELLTPGTAGVHIVEAGMKLGAFNQAWGQCIEELISSHLDSPSARQVELDDGRIIEIKLRAMEGGGWVATHEDVTEREKLRVCLAWQKEQLDAAMENMVQGLAMFDADQRLVVCNKRYADVYGLTPEQVKPGTTIRELLQYRYARGVFGNIDFESFAHDWLAGFSKASARTQELADGRVISIVRRPMPNGGLVSTTEDITERRRSEAKILHMARHDVLTNLPNRGLLAEQLENALARVKGGEQLALHFIDLDHFKTANDTLGHAVGDKLLQAVGDRLRQIARETEIVARLGGDEFAVVQVRTEGLEDVMYLAQALIATLSEPYDIDGHQIIVGASIGIALAPADGDTADQLLRNADLALYRAKENGRDSYYFFERGLDQRMQRRRALQGDLRKALSAGQFELHYQPLVSVDKTDIVAAEALIRWRHPEHGTISPADFIPLAEETGLIVPIGEWVIRRACATAAGWPSHVKVAVNLSSAQFRKPGLLQTVASGLAAAQLAPDRLELEITESLLLEASESVISTLHQLRALGVRITLDDFGTGYASLSYLQSFPLDKIKIDRSFIRDIDTARSATDIVRAIVALARALDMSVTAEGVETEAQLAALRDNGCTEAQGYLFSPPRPADDIEQLFLPAAAVCEHAA